ncbi:unnamed protein product [Chironomus riparius]|uniref:Uncharacterized protein n=1 Tax=Chironomus riparius TaxID=315576 RepID=A0A9N9RIF4_9DIPT|nr:unnamed protein product [Chironomus riparius]
MGIYVKIFAIMAVMCVVSCLPIDDVQKVNEPQVDQLAAESSLITDNDDLSDDLTRDKRHHRPHYGYYGNYRFPVGGYYGGYYPYSYGYPSYGGFGYGFGYQPIGFGGYGGFWG